MITLLPPLEKLTVKRLYRDRLIVVALVAMAMVWLIFIALLMPSRVVLGVKNKDAKARLETLKSNPSSVEARNLEGEVRDINKLTKVLDDSVTNDQAVASGLFADVLDYRSAHNVHIDFLSYRRDDSFTLRGVAATRSALLGFVNDIEREDSFSEVESPIANLIDNADIEFVVQAKLIELKEDEVKVSE